MTTRCTKEDCDHQKFHHLKGHCTVSGCPNDFMDCPAHYV